MRKKEIKKRPRGRPPGMVFPNKRVMMTFRLSQDIAKFLEAERINGKTKTAIIENAIRQVYSI